jgi:hypothetical protein
VEGWRGVGVAPGGRRAEIATHSSSSTFSTPRQQMVLTPTPAFES